MQSNYHGTAPYFISPAQGLLNYTKSVNLVPGLQATGDKSTTGIAAAAAAAAKAEVTIIVAGMSEAQEGEGHDRTDLELPGAQAELISTVTKAAKGKVILVVMSGGPVDLSAAKADPKIAAILIVGYPGQAGGLAIAETLFGDNPPAGKLTQTWYKASYAEQCHMTDMNMRPETKPEFPGWPVCIGRTYRFFKGDPVFKFGDGLSYTTFGYSSLAIDAAKKSVSFTLTNTGAVPGAEVAQLYLRFPPTAGEPPQVLKRFIKSDLLAPGASQAIAFEAFDPDFDLAIWDEDVHGWKRVAGECIHAGDCRMPCGRAPFASGGPVADPLESREQRYLVTNVARLRGGHCRAAEHMSCDGRVRAQCTTSGDMRGDDMPPGAALPGGSQWQHRLGRAPPHHQGRWPGRRRRRRL